jgi:hypothetical protein
VTAPRDPFAVTDQGQPADVPYGQQSAAPWYGEQPPYGAGTSRNGIGTAALVVGILAVLASITVVGGILFGVVAIILGAIGRGRAKRREATNGGSATAGLVLGIVGLVLSAALVAVGVSFLNSDTGKKLQNCLDSAGSDQAAQTACQQQFEDELTK